MKRIGNWKYWLLSSVLLAACVDTPSPDPHLPVIEPGEPQPVPTVGQTEFVSADGRNGEATQDNRGDDASANNGAAAPEAGADGDAADPRTVEEGDIYRVLGDSDLILNLNSFRGLQIIDFSDVNDPEIIGHVQVSGTPVEMYSVGDRVYVLLNNWRGYWGSRTDVAVDTFEGGLVLAIDASDPHNPQVTGQATIPGYIRSSRLTRGNGEEALFVVTTEWSTSTTYVQSYSVSEGGRLAAKTRIDVDTDGYLTDIQASPELLMVARWNWNQNSQGSEVTVIDISNPNGSMVEGDTITVNGFVQKKTNMDHTGNILRVVSGNNWSSNTNTNHVQTFDVSDIQNIQPVDSETFGDGEDLYATIFVEEKAFFVTYRRVDPFHAFHIDATGNIEEKSEFIISGWNDFFKPVSANTRLVGIGHNDQNGWNLAVSLYDIEDLTNPNPLVSRQELDLNGSWSEANWDDRAFTVLEKGTSVLAPTGETETGLVLLPFSGWDSQNSQYVSGVQIFTFSDTTLTKRGIMYQDTQVRRSFVADSSNNTTGNLSEAELSLFDTTDPDQPQELSRLELAPNFTGFLVFGNHGVRRHDNYAYWGWWGQSGNTMPTDTMQVVSLAGDVDKADAVAEFEIPSNAQIHKVGNLLVAVSAEYTNYVNNQPQFDTTIEVWDLSNPTQPTLKGSLATDKLPGGYYGYYDDYYYGPGRGGVAEGDVAGYGYYWYGQLFANIQVLKDAIVFVEREHQQTLEGMEKVTYYQPKASNYRWQDCYDQQTYEPKACTFITGGISCTQLTRTDGTVEDQVCYGSFQECTQDEDGKTDCNETTLPTSEQDVHTYEYEKYRYWASMNFHPVDLSDPANPKLGTVQHGGANNESVGTIAKGEDLYFSYKKPFKVPGDSRPYVKYYFRKFDFSDPANPTKGAPINVPGELIEVDGNTIITRDFLWGQNIVETAINKLEVNGAHAYLKGVNRFTDREVQSVQLDGAGHVLVSHRVSWLVNYNSHGYYDYDSWDNTVSLAILDLAATNFTKLGEVEIDDWASLTAAVSGRALFTVPGGMLVINTDDATKPHAQAYFALRGWPQGMEVKGDQVYFAAGPFGLYTFDTDTYNLQAAP